MISYWISIFSISISFLRLQIDTLNCTCVCVGVMSVRLQYVDLFDRSLDGVWMNWWRWLDWHWLDLFHWIGLDWIVWNGLCVGRVNAIGVGKQWLDNRIGWYWEFGLDGVLLVVVHWLIVSLVWLYAWILVVVAPWRWEYLLYILCSLDYIWVEFLSDLRLSEMWDKAFETKISESHFS